MDATPPQIPFVPCGYLERRCAGFHLWHHREEPASDITMMEGVMTPALAWLVGELGFEPKRVLHLCISDSHEKPVQSLARQVPANMAMALFASEEASLIVVQSPRSHPRNGDVDRMRRVLVHELCHTPVRERTGSTQILGEGIRRLRVRPWLDEGFAEAMSGRATGATPQEEPSQAVDWERDELDQALCDLGSYRRESAFAEAIRIVESFIAERGARGVFEGLLSLSTPS